MLDLGTALPRMSAGGQELGLGCPQEGCEQSGPRGPVPAVARVQAKAGDGELAAGGARALEAGGNFESSRQPASLLCFSNMPKKTHT